RSATSAIIEEETAATTPTISTSTTEETGVSATTDLITKEETVPSTVTDPIRGESTTGGEVSATVVSSTALPTATRIGGIDSIADLWAAYVEATEGASVQNCATLDVFEDDTPIKLCLGPLG